MSVATRLPQWLRLPNPNKTLAHWVDFLGRPLSRKHVSEILTFRGEPLALAAYFSNCLVLNYKIEYTLKNSNY